MRKGHVLNGSSIVWPGLLSVALDIDSMHPGASLSGAGSCVSVALGSAVALALTRAPLTRLMLCALECVRPVLLLCGCMFLDWAGLACLSCSFSLRRIGSVGSRPKRHHVGSLG